MLLIFVDTVLIFSPLSLFCCYNWIRIIVWAVWAMSMLSRLRTVFSFKIISGPGIILFMPIIVSVSEDTRDSFTMRFGPLNSWPPGLSLLGFLRVEILGASASQSRLRRVQQCNGSAQCRPVAGSYFISEHTRHCTRGSLPVSSTLCYQCLVSK